MLASGVRPDHFTLPLLARAALPGLSGVGEAVHSIAIQLGFVGDPYFCNSFIDYYARSEDIISARSLFEEMLVRDVVSWTTMISAYVQSGHISESSRMFGEMRFSGIEPNSVTLAAVLRASEVKRNADGGRQVHGFSIKRGFCSHELVQNSILTVYSKTGCFKEAEKLFDSIEERTVISWNILMSGYSSSGNFVKVVECFRLLIAAMYPCPQTLTLVISALTKPRDLRMGRQIHGYALKSGQIDVVLQAAFLDLYVKCADSSSSFAFLQEVSSRTSWIVMMWAFVHSGEFTQAISLFQRMQTAGIEPNSDALRCLVASYTHLGALLLGKTIHGYLIRHQLTAEPGAEILETSILNMYAKCGSIVSARRCFNNMMCRDTVAWSSMIDGYAAHGMGLESMELFRRMQEAGIRPNSITFLSLLSSCSHSGLVDEGCEVFNSITENFGMKPELSHYTCMVDILARSGKITESLNLIHSMHVKPDGRIWGALLGSCRVYQNVDVGEYAALRLFELEPDNVGYHIVLSNVHVEGDRWAKAESIWKSMDGKELWGRPGGSCIEEKGVFSSFVSSDFFGRR
ncbi:Pentatricopeptide repeat-containing protein [Platanthera guangdongensis]|uniref:Pentatricopeptide repeat-containing protein n=1 Tax=Platanthera guangdongensis TaxID=2320717 RepID=A0ABR2LV66_9ASPA